ncbi:MAG: hypothetical protein WCY84_03160, partial [Candidatus Cloacimonadaceae bacterium]
IEPAEIFTQQVIITDSVSIYPGVHCAHALLNAGAKHSCPYISNETDIVRGFGIYRQLCLSDAYAWCVEFGKGP